MTKDPMGRTRHSLPYLVLALFIAVTTASPNAEAAGRCAREDRSVDVSFIDYVTIAVSSGKGQTIHVAPLPAMPDWPKDVAGQHAKLVLPPTKSGRWRVTGQGTDCTLNVTDHLPPDPQPLGLNGPTVSGEVLRTLFSATDRRDSYVLILTSSSSRASGLQPCPNGRTLQWSSSDDLQLPDDWQRYRELFVKLSPESNLCAKGASVALDERQLKVQIGALTAVYDVASLAVLETPIFDGRADDCSTRIQDRAAPAETGASPCDGVVEIPGFPVKTHVRRQVRTVILSEPPSDGLCPEQPPRRIDPVVFSSEAYVCIYVEDDTPAANAAAGGSSDEGCAARRKMVPLRGTSIQGSASPASFSRFEFTPCARNGDQCVAAAPTSPGAPWRLTLPAGTESRVGLRVSQRGEKPGAGNVVQEYPLRRVTVKPLPDERILAGSVGHSPLCVKAPEDATLVSNLSAVITQGEQADRLATFEKDKGFACPSATVPYLSNDAEVRFLVGGQPYLRRTLVDPEKAHFESMRIVDADGDLFVRYDTRAIGTYSDVFEGHRICVTSRDTALASVSEIQLPTERLRFASGDRLGYGPHMSLTRTGPAAPSTGASSVASEFCGPMVETKVFGDDVAERRNLSVQLADCGTGVCTQFITERSWSFGFGLGVSVAGAMMVNPQGDVRVGGGSMLSFFNGGARLGNHWAISFDANVMTFLTSAPLGGNTSYDPDEQRTGTCVAGCDDVDRIALSGAFALAVGPCFAYQFFPWLSIPLCVSPGAGITVNSRAGAGFYENEGTYRKVGEKGDSHVVFEPSLFTTLGLKISMP